MQLYLLDYDPETDELDLLIDMDRPVPAEAVPVGDGIYIRREPSSGRIVGAFIRGYSGLLRRLCLDNFVPEMAEVGEELYEARCEVLEWASTIGRKGKPKVRNKCVDLR